MFRNTFDYCFITIFNGLLSCASFNNKVMFTTRVLIAFQIHGLYLFDKERTETVGEKAKQNSVREIEERGEMEIKRKRGY